MENKLLGVWHRPDVTGEEKTLEGICAVLDQFRQADITLVFVETFYHGMAVYRSRLVPYYTGFENNEYGDYPDYLTAFVAEAEKRGIEVHAWVEDFYMGVKKGEICENHPDWLLLTESGADRQSEGGGYIFLDPANKEVHEFLLSVYLELLDTVKGIKGINLDYIRYPLSSVNDDTGYTKAAKEGFERAYGKSLNVPDVKKYLLQNSLYDKWIDYRADCVTGFVKKIRKAVKQKYPDIAFSTAVFPERALSYETKKQDFSRWLKERLLDFVTPMAYYDDNEQLAEALEEMIGFCCDIPCYVGLSCTFHNLTVDKVLSQIKLSLQLGGKGAVFFGSQSLLGRENYISALKNLK